MKLSLWRVPRSWKLSQGFGKNYNSFYAENGLIGHTSDDWVAPYDTPIPSLCDGEVTWTTNIDDPDPSKYRSVFIRNGNYEISYGHLNEVNVNMGQKVKSGDILGTIGNTGDVYSGGRKVTKEEREQGSKAGTHLHGPQIREIEDWATYKVKNYDNGFKGCLNPEQFYSDYSIDQKQIFLSIIKLLEDFIKKVGNR
jgi:murein DD-endopeptidase MepM/ murein hydrolase activator NlpD